MAALVPDAAERRAVRTWLMPWATERGWWRPLLLLGAVLAGFRAVLLVFSHGTWYMILDSGEYLRLVHGLYVPRTRPPGVAVFWWGLLVPWSSQHALVLGQTLLGIVSGLLLYLAARELGTRSRVAFVVAVLGSCAPTVLFFERVLVTESLALFLVIATTWCALIALRSGTATPWAVTGLLAATSVLVRTAALVAVPVLALLALCIGGHSVLRKIAAFLAFAVASAVVLSGYAFAVYVDTRSTTGHGRFGLEFTDGYAYYVATAPLTDCSHPDKPPAIRAKICAIPGYIDQDPDVITWHAGPVNDALWGHDYLQGNSDLRQLALENVRRDPLAFTRLAGRRAVRLFTTKDNEYSTDARPYAAELHALGLPVFDGHDGLGDLWPKMVDVWIVLRWLLWLATVTVLVLVPTSWRRGGRALSVVVVPPVVTFLWLAIAATAVARYLLLFEPAGWLALAWLIERYALDPTRRFAILAKYRPSEEPLP